MRTVVQKLKDDGGNSLALKRNYDSGPHGNTVSKAIRHRIVQLQSRRIFELHPGNQERLRRITLHGLLLRHVKEHALIGSIRMRGI